MTEEEINACGYSLVKKLTTYKKNTELKGQNVLLESEKKLATDNWTDKFPGEMIGFSISPSGFKNGIWLETKEIQTGFEKAKYTEFRELTRHVHELFISVSLQFLEHEIFTWIIDIHKSNKSTIDLVNYIRDRIQEVKEKRTFLFEIINLSIDEPISVVGVDIQTYDEKKFQKFENSFKEREGENFNQNDFDDIFGKKLRTGVFAFFQVEGEPTQNEIEAKDRIKLAINILKIYDPVVPLPFRKSKFGVEFNLKYIPQVVHFTEIEDNLAITLKMENESFRISRERKKQIEASGLDIISEYVLNHPTSELKSLVIQAYNFFGEALSTENVHWRCVLIVQCLESLLLKDEKEKDMKKKVKQRFAKALHGNSTEKFNAKDSLDHIYNIRNSIIHKAKELDIEEEKLSRVQINICDFLHSIINNSKRINTKSELINTLDQIREYW